MIYFSNSEDKRNKRIQIEDNLSLVLILAHSNFRQCNKEYSDIKEMDVLPLFFLTQLKYASVFHKNHKNYSKNI